MMRSFRKAVAVGLLCGLALAGSVGGAGAAGAAPIEAGQRVNLNTANADELARLPGIGPSKAQAIIQYRTQQPFATADDLRKVKGIGDKLYDRVKDQVTVGDPGQKGHGG